MMVDREGGLLDYLRKRIWKDIALIEKLGIRK